MRQQAFPVLSDAQMSLLRPYGAVRPTRAGDILVEVGDAGYRFVLVLAAATEIVDRSEGTDQVPKTSGPGEFHDEIGLVTHQTVFLACRVLEPGTVLLVPPRAV